MWLSRAVPVRYLGSYRRPQKPPWMRCPVVFYSDSSEKKGKVAPLQETRMRDRFTLYSRGGEGGSGCSSLRRSRADRYGKPDGGNGGRGGDVILECTHVVWDFSGLQPHVKGGRAGHGTSKNRIGNRGEDKYIGCCYEEDDDTCYYAGPRVSLWSSEPEPIVASAAFPTFASETQLNQIKDQQNLADQRLVHLEKLEMELGEKFEMDLGVKKPLVQSGNAMVVFIVISICVLVMGMILVSK